MRQAASMRFRFIAICALGVTLYACTHTIQPISVSQTATSQPKQIAITLVIPQATRDYVYEHNSAPEVWRLEVGRTIEQLAREMFSRSFENITVLDSLPREAVQEAEHRIVELRIEDFDAHVRFSQFKDDQAQIVLNATVADGSGNQLWSGKIRGDSTAKNAIRAVQDPPWRILLTGYDQTLRSVMMRATYDGINQLLAKVNEPSGTFESARSVKIVNEPRRVAIRDLDGDGINDVIATDASCGISLHFGKGDGSFRRSLSLDAGTFTTEPVIVSDLNADGVTDLVATGHSK